MQGFPSPSESGRLSGLGAPAPADQRLLIFGDATSVHLQRWVAQMASHGFDVHVATRRPAAVPGASTVTAVNPGASAWGWFTALRQVRRLTRRLGPRWVHGHYVTSYGLWAAACGLHPVVLTAWGSDILVTPAQHWWMRALVGWTLRHADLITADSSDMLQAITVYHPQAACHLVSWGADTEFFTPADVPAQGFDVVSLRSWEALYSIDVLIEGFARFIQQHPQARSRLHLLGGGSLEASLREQVGQRGLDSRVVFHGRLDDAGMRSVLRQSRVCVSVPLSDATSVSMLEAMACGLSIIASDLPANRACLCEAASAGQDIGDPGEAGGRLVPVDDAQAVALALGALYRDAAACRRAGERNRRWVLEHASRQTHMARMASLYRRLRGRP